MTNRIVGQVRSIPSFRLSVRGYVVRTLLVLMLWTLVSAAGAQTQQNGATPRSVMATLRLTCPTVGARLYVNGTFVAQDEWKGTLRPGRYLVEARKETYVTERDSITLDSCGVHEFALPALTHTSDVLPASDGDVEYFIERKDYVSKAPSDGYVQPLYQFGSLPAAGLSLGADLSGFNMEAAALYGLTSEDITWSNGRQNMAETLHPLLFRVRLGYDFRFFHHFGLTPQLGVGAVVLNGSVSKSSAMCGSLSLRLKYQFVRHFGLFVAPSFGMLLTGTKSYEAISSVSSRIKGWSRGFNVSVGAFVSF